MNVIKTVAILSIVLGVLSLAYGSFSYTKATHDVNLGPIELSVKDKETVNVPVWVGVGSIAAGTVMLLVLGSTAGSAGGLKMSNRWTRTA
jgi:hypothetical protein